MPNPLLRVLAAEDEESDVRICIQISDDSFNAKIFGVHRAHNRKPRWREAVKFACEFGTVQRTDSDWCLVSQEAVITGQWRPARPLVRLFRGAQVESASSF